ncbi:MAG TPA: class II glutamine amidotransferase [Thermoplasmata archaeon]|nr:class II glutamine amidotransferase [Thermoplasmata archaeon]
MCRWFGQLSARPALAQRWLVQSERSLLKQANAVPTQLQADGWGIAWFDASRQLHVEKGTEPVFQKGESERFRSAARKAKSSVVIGHVRRASNPMGLPADRLVGMENSQPFAYGSTVFAHNGTIPYPLATRSALGRFDAEVHGVNDSEVLFWLLVRHLESSQNPPTAFGRAIADLIRVWRNRQSQSVGPYTGLNVVLSRGPDELWAFCKSRGEHGRALMDPDWPYYELAYSAAPELVLVASEPLDGRDAGWKALHDGQYLYATVEEKQVSVHTGTIPISPEAKLLA